MAMLRICAAPGCVLRTLGEYCVEHELTERDKRKPVERPAQEQPTLTPAA